MFGREHCHLLVLSPDQQRALTCYDDNDNTAHPWDLPYFSSVAGYTKSTEESISHLHEELGLDPSLQYFTGIADIAGDRTCGMRGDDSLSRIGHGRVILVDTQDYSFELPDNCEWKKVEFLLDQKEKHGCRCEIELSMRRAAMFVTKSEELIKELYQPRFQFGWFKRASRWLREVVEKQGMEAQC